MPGSWGPGAPWLVAAPLQSLPCPHVASHVCPLEKMPALKVAATYVQNQRISKALTRSHLQSPYFQMRPAQRFRVDVKLFCGGDTIQHSTDSFLLTSLH